MASSDEDLLNGITVLTPTLLTTLEAFEQVQRNMHPNRIDQLAEFINPFEANLKHAFEEFKDLQFPEHIEKFGKHLKEASTYALRACNGITDSQGDTWAAMKAMRAHSRAQEKLYPIASILKPISQYFLEMYARENSELLGKLAQERPGAEVGLLNANNSRETRGGFSLYIPEYLDPEESHPLVIALHGGTGHGADFVWAWLREARTRGFILMAPTSQGDTWALMEEDIDLPVLVQEIEFIANLTNVDRDHILLTGMSDGGTYSLLAGLQAESPFTHLAPFSGVLHPEITMSGNIVHARDKPIYLVHGTQDWMFPVETAQMAEAELIAAGANLTCRIIEGLSHTYARTENPALLDWFLE
ncbi:MAG: phospholipase [Gammaproteobacteria bacterium]|jgi:phospholipase/carboxylesterase|nr:phospholipase [Gammaproteobacteria bacterium]MBT4493570.1 phospholipase [Gammaproteobacteria bacterium]MBT7371603.1 phospholipase [Gammaproteobacteria bacterium]